MFQAVEDPPVQRLPDPGYLPVAEASPAGAPAPAQRAAIGQPRATALAVRRAWWEERRDQRPPVGGDERFQIHGQ